MKKEVIFFWIPKNAGSSIYSILKKHGCKKIKYAYKKFNNEGSVTFCHLDVTRLLRDKHITQEYFNRSFKFCFARNPWSRTVSLYHYLKYDERMTFEEFARLLEKKFELRKTLKGKIILFAYKGPDIIFRIINRLSVKINFTTPIPPIGKYNVRDLSQANPQTDWIIGKNGQPVVDFIGKVENMENDIKKCFNIIGIDVDEIPILNQSNHENYKKYYTEKTKQIIKNIYKRDIDFFNYEF